jgi:sulfate transport system ATP-binding protein
VADRIVVMNKGRVEQDGTPEQVYDHPANPFVYEFLGTVNLFHARVRDGDQLVQPSSADLPAAAEQLEQPGLAYVRPHEIDVLHAKEEDAIAARLDLITVVGPTVRLELQSQQADQIIHVELDKTRFKQLGLSVGQHTWLKPRYSRVFLGEGI